MSRIELCVQPELTIKYALSGPAEVGWSVYDLPGREVSVLVNERRVAGFHEVKCDGSGRSSGVYFYRIEVRSVLREAEDESLALRGSRRADPLDSAIGRDSKSGTG